MPYTRPVTDDAPTTSAGVAGPPDTEQEEPPAARVDQGDEPTREPTREVAGAPTDEGAQRPRATPPGSAPSLADRDAALKRLALSEAGEARVQAPPPALFNPRPPVEPPGPSPRPTPPGGSGAMSPTSGTATSGTPIFHGEVERVAATTTGLPVTAHPPEARSPQGAAAPGGAPPRAGMVRARKVHRVLRHIEPWSVLKLSVLFYAALFLIVCVASGLLWGAARASGTIDNVESFVTSVGGFGNCEPINGEASVTASTVPAATSSDEVDQLDAAGPESAGPDPGAPGAATPGDEDGCREGERLVGQFRFEDARIFLALGLAGIVLVLAGSAANVVMVLLFNLMSDLTGGVRVTVLEETGTSRPRAPSGSPPA